MNINETMLNPKLFFIFYIIINTGFSQSNQTDKMIFDTIQSVSQNYGLDAKEIYLNFKLKSVRSWYDKELLIKYEDFKNKYYAKDNFKDRNYELVNYLQKYVGYIKYGNEVISSSFFHLNEDGKSILVKSISSTKAISINLSNIDKSSIKTSWVSNFPISFIKYYTITFKGKNCIKSGMQEYFSAELQFKSNSSFGYPPTTRNESKVKKVRELLFYQ